MTYSRRVAARLLAVAFPTRAVVAIMLTQPSRDASDVFAFAQRGSGNASGIREMPGGKNVAIVLRGETFRYAYRDSHGREHRSSCARQATDVQMNCTTSLIEKVIEPLERNGNRVEVFFTSVLPQLTRMPALFANTTSISGDCALDDLVVSALQANPKRMVKAHRFSTTGQADTVWKALGSFNHEYGGIGGVSANFDYILLVRNDLTWFKAIDQIRVEFDNVNVLSRCWAEAEIPNCVHDSLWMMPGDLYNAFNSCLGQRRCFNQTEDPVGSGHGCQRHIRAAIAQAGHPDAFGWLESAQRHVREFLPDQHVADLAYMPKA